MDKQVTYMMEAKEVRNILRNAKRPLSICFACPCSRSHWKKILMPNGETKIQKWGDSDVIVGSGYDCRHTFLIVFMT